MRYVYLDESTFSSSRSYVGYGALATDDQVDHAVVMRALDELRRDPDRNHETTKALDDGTLERGFFHASEDSKNAHSHLCTQISRAVHGVCSCQFLDPAREGRATGHGLQLHAAALSSLHAFDTRDQMRLCFEARDGLSKDLLTNWYRELRLNILRTAYESPWIPILCPPVEFIIEGKQTPGLQVSDFLLWAVNRYVGGDERWVDRVRTTMRTGMSAESGGWGEMTLVLGHGIREATSHYGIEDVPVAESREWRDRTVLHRCYMRAEDVLAYYHRNGLPTHARHLEEEVKWVFLSRDKVVARGYPQMLAAAYLGLFDLVPLINENTLPDDKRFLLVTKKMFGLILRTDLIPGMVTAQLLSKLRSRRLSEHPGTVP